MHCRVHAGLSNQAQYFSERIRLYSISRVINFPGGNVEYTSVRFDERFSHGAAVLIHTSEFSAYLTCVKRRRRRTLVAADRRKKIRTAVVIGMRVMIHSATILDPKKCILWEIHEDSYNLCRPVAEPISPFCVSGCVPGVPFKVARHIAALTNGTHCISIPYMYSYARHTDIQWMRVCLFIGYSNFTQETRIF